MNKFEPYRRGSIIVFAYQVQEQTVINSSKGEMRAEPGDYIVRGAKGELYPMKAEIFQTSYGPIKEE